jgi:hypothetical protein
LASAEFALNSTKTTATGYSPFFVIYGKEPSLPIDNAMSAVKDCTVPAVETRIEQMRIVHLDVVD